MRKPAVTLLAMGFLASAIFCALAGYRSYRLFVVSSQGTSEATIRLDVPGRFAVSVDPPGTSVFRPGGVLRIFVTRHRIPVPVQDIVLGRGSLRVTDRTGGLCLEEPLHALAITDSDREQYYSVMREFEISGGGPYQVAFEITEPFRGLEDTHQTLSARHFVSGGEAVIHCLYYGIAGLCGGISLLLLWRIRARVPALRSSFFDQAEVV